MKSEIFHILVTNTAFLLTLLVVYESLRLRAKLYSRTQKILCGLSIGLIGMVVMAHPPQFIPGINVDSRSILLGLSGFFFGLLPTVVAAAMTIVFRFYQGGAGVFMGIAVIVASAALGLAWKYRRRGRETLPSLLEFYLFGFAVHTALLLCFLFLPRASALQSQIEIAPVVMLIFPVVTALLGKFMVNHLTQSRAYNLIERKEKQLARAQKIGRMGNWEYDLNSGMVTGSDETRRIYGISDEALNIAEIQRISLPEYRALLDKAMTDLIAGTRAYDVCFRIRRPEDGRLADIHSQAEYDIERDVVVGTIQDVTEQCRAEEKLVQSEERLALVLKGTGAGLWDWKVQTGEVILDERWAEMVGYSLQELEPVTIQTWYDLVHPEDLQRNREQLEKHFSGELEQYDIECRMKHKSGNWIWIQDRGRVVSRNEDGKPLRMAGTHLEITARKRKDDLLLASEKTCRALFDATTAAISIQNIEDFSLVDVNKGFLDVYGFDSDETKTVQPGGFFNQDGAREYDTGRESLERILAGETVQLEVRDRKKDGSLIWMDKTIRKVAINGIERIMTVAQDITEKKMMQQIMVRTEKNTALGGLAAGMAHEINNPLGIIAQGVQNVVRRTRMEIPANLEVAEECRISFDSLQRYLEKRNIPRSLDAIHDAVLRAAGIIENMLEFSRGNETPLAPVDVNRVLEKAVALAGIDYDLKKKYDFRNIHMDIDLSPLPNVRCSDSELEQVFLNLLRNSAQSLWRSGREKPVIRIRTWKEDRKIVVEIEDNGEGIDPDVQARIFEPFFTTKKPGEGTGLGLPVSFHIVVQRHQGEMTVQSEPDAWTRFRIKLPLAGHLVAVGNRG